MDTAAVRQLALGWRWWAAHGTTDAGEQFAWRQAAMELEDLAGLPHPDRATVDREGGRSDAEKVGQMYAVVRGDLTAHHTHPTKCTLTAAQVTEAINALPRPLDAYRVLRAEGQRVEVVYTAHEWMREMT